MCIRTYLWYYDIIHVHVHVYKHMYVCMSLFFFGFLWDYPYTYISLYTTYMYLPPTECPDSTYKPEAANTDCQSCAGPNQVVSPDRTQCVCDQGYTGVTCSGEWEKNVKKLIVIKWSSWCIIIPVVWWWVWGCCSCVVGLSSIYKKSFMEVFLFTRI